MILTEMIDACLGNAKVVNVSFIKDTPETVSGTITKLDESGFVISGFKKEDKLPRVRREFYVSNNYPCTIDFGPDLEVIQKEYDDLIKRGNVDELFTRVTEIGISPSIDPNKLEELYSTLLKSKNFDSVKKLYEATGVKVNESAIQNAYLAFASDVHKLRVMRDIYNFTRVKPSDDVVSVVSTTCINDLAPSRIKSFTAELGIKRLNASKEDVEKRFKETSERKCDRKSRYSLIVNDVIGLIDLTSMIPSENVIQTVYSRVISTGPTYCLRDLCNLVNTTGIKPVVDEGLVLGKYEKYWGGRKYTAIKLLNQLTSVPIPKQYQKLKENRVIQNV